MIWVLGLFLFHSFFTVKFEFIVLSLLYLGQVRVKPWKFASFCQALPLHAHSSLKWKSFLTNVMLHKGVYSLHTYNYSTWCRTPTKKTRSPPHWGLLDMNICHLNKCHQVHQFEDFTWPRRIGEKKKKSYIFKLMGWHLFEWQMPGPQECWAQCFSEKVITSKRLYPIQ